MLPGDLKFEEGEITYVIRKPKNFPSVVHNQRANRQGLFFNNPQGGPQPIRKNLCSEGNANS